jgi:hypothetical protein
MKKIVAIVALLTLVGPPRSHAADYSSDETAYLKLVAQQVEAHNNLVATKIGNSGRLTDGRYLCHRLDSGASVGNMADEIREQANKVQDRQAQLETAQYFSAVTVAAIDYLCPEHKPELKEYLQDH